MRSRRSVSFACIILMVCFSGGSTTTPWTNWMVEGYLLEQCHRFTSTDEPKEML